MIRHQKIFAVFFTFLFCLSAYSADTQYKVSDGRIDTIQSIIARSVADREDLTNNAVIQAIYEKVAAEMPLMPSVPIVQVDLKKLNGEARRKTEAKFKIDLAKLKKKYAAEASKKFPMNALKDKVTVNYKRGSVSGILYRITSTNVLINSTTVSFIDMDQLTRSRFDAPLNKDLREQYIRERISSYVIEFNREQQKIFEKLLEEANGENEKNGYIFVKRREVWKTAKDITTSNLDIEVEKYKKMKEKQERIRRKREARELAAREAKEKEAAESAARAAEEAKRQQEETEQRNLMQDNVLGGKTREQQMQENTVSSISSEVLEDETKPMNPRDIFGTESKNGLEMDDGGNFIALSAEQLAALSRPKVNEEAYKKLMEEIENKQKELGKIYFGVDADQGFKKALWGFRETDVYYALSKETDAVFFKKVKINRNDILYPPGSRPQKIYLHYHLGALYKVEIYVGRLKENEFHIMKNSLRQKYGKSDTQKQIGDDIFDRIVEGKLTPNDLPQFKEAGVDETGVEPDTPAGSEQANDGQNAENNNGEPASESEKPYYFVWEGILSRCVLSFYYNTEKKVYEDVLIRKVYLPLRLKKYQEKQAEAEAAAKAKKEQKEASAAATEAEGKAKEPAQQEAKASPVPGKTEPEKTEN